MNDHKLYSVIGGGYRNILRAALISRLYPFTSSDIVYANPLTVVSLSMQDALLADATDTVNISSLGIVSGELTTVEVSRTYQEYVYVSNLNIVSGELKEVVVSPANPTTDIVAVNPLQIVNGELRVVVVPVEPSIETVNVSSLNIISGSLT